MALTPEVAQRLEALRTLQRLLDDAFRVPGTSLRFGWDPIDRAGAVGRRSAHRADVVRDRRAGAPHARAARRAAPDAGQRRDRSGRRRVPVVGDVADVFWKSNTKNFALLERHADEVRPATAGDWLFVAAHPARDSRRWRWFRSSWCTGLVGLARCSAKGRWIRVQATPVRLARVGCGDQRLSWQRVNRIFLLSPANCGGTPREAGAVAAGARSRWRRRCARPTARRSATCSRSSAACTFAAS